jgi:hypothetical protein
MLANIRLCTNNSRIGYAIDDVTGERKLIEKTECEKDLGKVFRSEVGVETCIDQWLSIKIRSIIDRSK